MERHLIFKKDDLNTDKLVQLDINRHQPIELWLMNEGEKQPLGYYKIEKKMINDG